MHFFSLYRSFLILLACISSIEVVTSSLLAPSSNGKKRNELTTEVLRISMVTESFLPSAYLRRYIERNFPLATNEKDEDKDSDDYVEPIQAGASNNNNNRASSPVNPVTPCTPIAGKTAIVIGQDLYSITNYTTALTGHPSPVGYMGYTALKNTWGELTGLKHRIDYGGGVQWVDGLTKMYPTAAIQLGLWLVGQCEDIVVGVLDHNIQRLAKYIKDHGKHHAFYLRIGYEFDSTENHYDAGFYRIAFQRIVNIFREVNTTNVAFVWHASGFPIRDDMHVSDWYPGARYVDWCGISLFQQPYTCSGGTTVCKIPAIEDILSFCREHNLPTMIAESTPYGGIVDEKTMMKNPEAHNEAGIVGDTWTRWFEPVLSLIERHDIRMWSYINCNWDLQEMWQVNHAPNELWGDSRIEAYSGIHRKWLEYVLHAPRFQMFTVPMAPPVTTTPSAAPTIAATTADRRRMQGVNGTTNNLADNDKTTDNADNDSGNKDKNQPAADTKKDDDTSDNDDDNHTLTDDHPTATPTASPSISLSPSFTPTMYPTLAKNLPVSRLHADVCTPPRTQVLLQKHPDYTDDEYGDPSLRHRHKNHSASNHDNSNDNLPPGGGSIPHHRKDFYLGNEKVILRNMLEIMVFFLEFLEVFLAILFLIAVLVLVLSCMYKYCSRTIDFYREEQEQGLLRMQQSDAVVNKGYQSLSQQDEENNHNINNNNSRNNSKNNSAKSDKNSEIAMTNLSKQRSTDRKGYVIIE